MCQVCEQVHILIKEFDLSNDFKFKFKAYAKAITILTKLYDEKAIDLYAADLHFSDTIKAFSDEIKYTIQQYFFCRECMQVFAIGACIRGEPYFIIVNNIKSKKYNIIFRKDIYGKLGIYYENHNFLRKKFMYIFQGTRDDLIRLVEIKQHEFLLNEKADYRLFNYNESTISLGIGRTGHSGGYFFSASLITINNQVIINGNIEKEKNYMSKLAKGEKILFVFLNILFFIPGIILRTLFRIVGLEETKRKRKKRVNKFFIKYIKCKKIDNRRY